VFKGATIGKTIFTCIYIGKKIFSRTMRPISIKRSTNHSWVKVIQDYTNKGPGPLQRADNYKNVKMGWGHLKIFFSRTTAPEEFIFT
jgi:hypothetical protein